MERKVAVIVGSLREGSWNRKIAKELMKTGPGGMKMELVEIADLPLYNEDLEAEGKTPAAWTRFREAVKGRDAVLFVTPEYNRGMTGAIKNAIDVGSRPWGKSVWNARPSAVMSASIGGVGGFGANHQVRQAMVTLNSPCMPGPEAYIGAVDKKFNEKGELTDEGTKGVLEKFGKAFAEWVGRHADEQPKRSQG